MDNLIKCTCGNDTWFVQENKMECTSCKTIRSLPVCGKRKDESEVLKTMGIPETIPNAYILAQARLSRLQKKEAILSAIQKLIDEEA